MWIFRFDIAEREGFEGLRINRATFISKTAEVGKRYASRANIDFTAKTDAIFKRII